MSDPLASPASLDDVRPISSASAPTAGQLLRRAREAEGLHIAALAVTLKVPVKKLEALEADRLDLLADVVFARALVGSFCRVLKVDPIPILAQLPPSDGPRLKTDEIGINEPFKGAQGDGAAYRLLGLARKPLVLAIFALIVATLVLVFVPLQGLFGSPMPAGPATSRPSPIQQGQSAGPPVVPAEVLVQPEARPLAVEMAVGRPASSLTVPAEVATLQLNAKGTSWVEVVDAKGGVQLRRFMVAPEKVSVSGALPLAVVLGKAGNIEVMVRGKAVDVSANTRDNVARFEVK